MKFKRILALFISVIMLFGNLSALPAAKLYAAQTETATIKIDCPVKCSRPDRDISIWVYAHDENGEINDFTLSITGAENPWNGDTEPPADIAKEYTYIKKSDTVSPGAITLHIGEKEPNKKEIKITASAKNSTISDSCVVTVWTGVYFSVDYSTGFGLLQTSGDDSFLFLEISKKKGDTQGKGNIYCYRTLPQSECEILVDLSFLKLSKDVYFYAYGDENTESLKQDVIYAMPKKKASIKFTYKPDAKFSDLFVVKNAEKEDLEYRKQGGSVKKGDLDWKPLEYLEGELDNLMVTGTTLLVRQMGKENSNMPGSEIKLKIPAAPKAPKIKRNYAKNTITLLPNSQVRIPGWFILSQDGEIPYYYQSGSKKTDLSPADLKKKLVDGYIEEYNKSVDKLQSEQPKKDAQDKEKLLADLEKDCTLFIRTSDAKKGNSQPVFINIKQSPVIEVVSGSAVNTIAEVLIDREGNKTYGSGKVTFSYDMTAGKEKVTLTASENNLFAYSLDNGKKFTKIKTNGTDVKLSKVRSNILIRMEGFDSKEDETESRWASEAVELPKNN